MANIYHQFRRKGTQVFHTSLLTPGLADYLPYKSKSPFPDSDTIFNDFYLRLAGNGQLTETVNNDGIHIRCFFLRIRVEAQQQQQTITVRLGNSAMAGTAEEQYQDIESIIVPVGPSGVWYTYDFVIHPNNQYDQIRFVMMRNETDYNDKHSYDEYYGRVANIEILRYDQLHNLLRGGDNALKNQVVLDTNDQEQIKQLGIQSLPGLKMCIDGEMVRVGKSGIYEVNNGIAINFLSFIVSDTDKTIIIMDYQC